MGAVYLRKNLEVSAPLAIWLVLFEFCIGLGRGQVLTGVGIIINHYQSLAVDFYIFSNIFNFEIYGLSRQILALTCEFTLVGLDRIYLDCRSCCTCYLVIFDP